jgi:prophage antirepressor-like protein
MNDSEYRQWRSVANDNEIEPWRLFAARDLAQVLDYLLSNLFVCPDEFLERLEQSQALVKNMVSDNDNDNDSDQLV